MKFYRQVLGFLFLQGAAAFMPKPPAPPSVKLNVLTQGVMSDLPPFPTNEPFKRIQGGGTVMTWPMPTDAERVEMMFRSSGRPMKVTGERNHSFWLKYSFQGVEILIMVNSQCSYG